MDRQSTFAASLDVEWVVEVPSDRPMVVVKLTVGRFEWRAGSVHTLTLGDGDVAALYAQIPGVRIRPNAAKKHRAQAEPAGSFGVTTTADLPGMAVAVETSGRVKTTRKSRRSK